MAVMNTTFDPITLEILSNKVNAAAEEMSFTLQRTGRTLYVKETADFATALVDLKGRFFAYPRDIGVSNFMDLDCMPTIAAVPDLQPGDVIMTNHPFLTEGMATHLPDLHMIQPYFHDGVIVAYGWCFIHCTDIGGRVPSSISPSNDEIYQEGLMIPPVRIMVGGRENKDFLSIFRANSRAPEENAGDLKAMLASLATGGQRVAELIEQHGVETFVVAQEALQDYSAKKARAVLRQIPDGVYSFTDYLDDDFNSSIPVRLHLTMTAQDGKIHLDYSSSDTQVASAYNVPTGGKRHPWLTLRLIAFILSYDNSAPVNAGLYRSISINTAKGTIIDPEYPAAVGVRHATATRVNDVLNGALATAVPKMMKAPSGGVTVPVIFSEPILATGGRKVLVLEPMVGGSGGRHGADGADGRDSGIANLANNPIESVERDCDVIVRAFAIRIDSGGAGKWRGGHGLELAFEVLTDDCNVLGRGMERFRFGPWGMEGGKAGAPFRVTVTRADGTLEEIGKIDVLVVNKGDLVTMLTPGGGGYGDPLERDLEAVQEDVRRGLISVAAAARDYGVILKDGVVDGAATAALRREKAAGNSNHAFDWGAERDAWESVFEDDKVAELNSLLLKLPLQLRLQRRSAIFDDVVGGVPRAGSVSLAERLASADTARANFARHLEELKSDMAASA